MIFRKVTAGLISALLFVGLSVSSSAESEIGQMRFLKTSYNPDCYADITIDGDTVKISGVITDYKVTGVYFQHAYSLSHNVSQDQSGAFSVELPTGRAKEQDDKLCIVLDDKLAMSYRIEYDYNSGWYFPDNGTAQRYPDVIAEKTVTHPKVWASYVCADLDKECTENTLAKVKALSDEIVAGIDNDYDKAVALSHWVSENIYYDFDARDKSVTEETVCLEHTLKERRTVCVGFSNLYAALCQAQGLQVLNIRGCVTSDEIDYSELDTRVINHEWNCVLIDGRWVTIDTVWNTNNRYKDGKFTKKPTYDKYTDITAEALSLDHCAYVAEQRNFFDALSYFEQENNSEASDGEEFKNSSESAVSSTDSDSVVSYTDVTSEPHPEPHNPVTEIINTVILVICGVLLSALVIILIRKNMRHRGE